MFVLCRLLLLLCWGCAAPTPAPVARGGVLDLLRRLSQPERLGLRPLDRVVLKGKTEALRLVEVLDALPEEIAAKRRQSLEEFRQGIAAWDRGAFAAARLRFQVCLLDDPDDGPAQRMMDRCDEELAQPTPDWPGYTTLTQK